jgi:hypothetical protein
VPVLIGHLQHWFRPPTAGIINQDIDRTKCFQGLGHHRFHIVRFGYITRRDQGSAAEVFHFFASGFDLLRRARSDDEIRTGLSQGKSHCASKSTSRPCHDGRFPS